MENDSKSLTQGVVMRSMDWAYQKAVSGVPGLDSARDLAFDYLNGSGTLRDKVNSLIRWQNTKAGASGFVTGLGGLLTLPATLPLNLTSVLFVQIRMIAAIAIMGGYDVRDDRVQTLVYSCLVSTSASEVVKQTGIKIGNKVAGKLVERIPGVILREINRKVSFKLFTKFGEKGIINLGKTIPVIGGIIGGAFDIVSTNTVGNVARDTFMQ